MSFYRHFLLPALACLYVAGVCAQKSVHIPYYLQNPNDPNGSQFTWSKTAQSDNFIVIWGNTVGLNPATYPDPNLAFDPNKILDTLEYLYAAFKGYEFLDDSPGTNLAQYKIPVVIYNTWGTNGAQGFANGGSADGIIGAFWVHPNALHDGAVAAHELTHSLQAQCVIDYRNDHGLGNVWNNAGIFWETHANFMRNLIYPWAVTAWGMDLYHVETWGDWKNTYENYPLLMAIMDSEGIGMINRIWRESFSDEYPLQAYKRLAGYNQARFNDSLYHYARRMATYDFNFNNLGKKFRQYRNADLQNHLPTVQNVYSILRAVPGATNRYEIPIEQAPEEFAYNVIPLYPDQDSCAVIVRFKGHTEANSHAGWRYGFVAAKADGTVSRYSPAWSDNTAEIHFKLEGNETRMYLVVMGAPFDQITTNTSNDTWQGYPKHFRFPYELTISGAKPEGFQAPAAFRAQLRNNGHTHSNGGGWVQNTANVAASVYVGPTAMVLGNATLSGQVRIENTAIVRNAVMSGQVKIQDNALVTGGNFTGSAIVRGQGFAENVTMSNNALIGMRARVSNYKLSGTVEVGGDVVVYNETGNCNNGVHYRLTNYYDNKLLECDGRTATHPANLDVNNSYTRFSDEQMALQCFCSAPMSIDSVQVAPAACAGPPTGSVQFFLSNSCGPFVYTWSDGSATGTGTTGLGAGNYTFSITDNLGREQTAVVAVPQLATPVVAISATDYVCSSAGGAASVQVSGGTAPFTYAWSHQASGPSLENLLPGAYEVTVTDAAGCSAIKSVAIGLSGMLETTSHTVPPACHGGSDGMAAISTVNALLPVAWLWSSGATTAVLTDVPAGDYAVTATDAAGCTATVQVSLTVPAPLQVTLSAENVSCAGAHDGMAQVLVSGATPPYTFEWSSGETTPLIASLDPGTYLLTVTDAHLCTAQGNITLSEPTPLAANIHSPEKLCPLETAALELLPVGGTGPYGILWSNGDTTVHTVVTGPGIYMATITDGHNCVLLLEALIAPADPLLLESSATAASCFGLSDGAAAVAPLSGTAPFTWLWSDGQTTATATGLPAGPMAVLVTDALGCSGEVSTLISEPEALVLMLHAPAAVCPGTLGAISMEAGGGTAPYVLFWNTGDTSSTITAGAGFYSVTLTDANACTQTASAVMVEADPIGILFELEAASASVAADGAIHLTETSGGTGPYLYLWSTGDTSASLLNVLPGAYTLSVSDAAGCSAEFSFFVPFSVSTSALPQKEIDAVIYPNPSRRKASLRIQIIAPESLFCKVYDARGSLMSSSALNVPAGESQWELSVPPASGLYTVVVQDGKGKSKALRWIVAE